MQSVTAMVAERRTWGRAYRDGEVVCDRVHVAMGRDDRLGLTRHERPYVAARFVARLHPTLRDELTQLTRRGGAAARRAADRMDPIEIVCDGRRIIGWVQPPQVRHGQLREIEFVLRERAR